MDNRFVGQGMRRRAGYPSSHLNAAGLEAGLLSGDIANSRPELQGGLQPKGHGKPQPVTHTITPQPAEADVSGQQSQVYDPLPGQVSSRPGNNGNRGETVEVGGAGALRQPMMNTPGFQAGYRVKTTLGQAFQPEYGATQANGRIVPSRIYRATVPDRAKVNEGFSDGPTIAY